MLHKRRLSDSEANDLRLVYEAKLKFLYWLLRKTPPTNFGLPELQVALGHSLARWFFIRIKKPAKRTSFGKAVDALCALASSDPVQAENCASAIENDVTFDVNWDVAGFSMQFPGLPSGWREAIKAVCEPFYEDWLSSKNGYSKKVFCLSNDLINRQRIMQAFQSMDFEACGYCDGPLGDVGTEHEANDCDHFFPKADWPHLAIHPRNLFAACKACNQTWKGDKSPMGRGDIAGLAGTYHPEFRAAVDSVSFQVKASQKGLRELALRIEDLQSPQRASSMVNLLDLEARWTKHVNKRLRTNLSAYVSEGVRLRAREPVTEALIEDVIQIIIYYRSAQKGRISYTLREIAVLEFQCQSQIASLVAECSH